MLFSDQLSIRTVCEPLALCLLESNQRSMLPFIGRPKRSSRLRSHRDTVGSQHQRSFPVSSSLSFIEGHIRLVCHPETMKQNCQFSRNSNDCFFPGILPASLGQMESPSSERAVLTEAAKDEVGAFSE